MTAAAAPPLDRALEALTLRGLESRAAPLRGAGGDGGEGASSSAAAQAGFPRDEVVRLATAEAMRLVRIGEVRRWRNAERGPPVDPRR